MLLMVHRLMRSRNKFYRKMRNREGGFTLLEVLLTILLLGTGFAAILQVMSAGLLAGGANENEIIAANLVQEKIEELRNTQYSSIAEETPPVIVTGFPAFTREVLVTTPQTDLKQITVKVYWFVKSVQTNLTMVTYASDI